MLKHLRGKHVGDALMNVELNLDWSSSGIYPGVLVH